MPSDPAKAKLPVDASEKPTSAFRFSIPNLMPPQTRTWRQGFQAYLIFTLAAVAWLYLLTNTFILSVDRVALEYLPENYAWLVNYKFLIFLVALLAVIAKVGTRSGLFYIFYFLFFPFIQFFWVSYVVVRQRSWLLFFAFANTIISIFSNLKRKFQMFVYFVLIAVLALTVSQSIILWLVLALAVYLASAQVVIAFLQATKPTELVGSYLSIAQFIRRNGEEKTFGPSSEYNSLPVEQLTESQLTEFASRVQLSFMFAHFCAMFSRQIGAFQESSWRLIPTIFSIMALFASNVILYAFANFALFKIDAGQFAHVPSIKFFDFFYYAFNNLLFNSIGEVGATGTAARLLHISQTATIFFILAVVVGSYMSMRDQAFTDKLKEVSAGFDVLAKEMEQHIEAKFGFGSVEDALAGFEEARMFLLRTFLTFTSESRGRSGS